MPVIYVVLPMISNYQYRKKLRERRKMRAIIYSRIREERKKIEEEKKRKLEEIEKNKLEDN